METSNKNDAYIVQQYINHILRIKIMSTDIYRVRIVSVNKGKKTVLIRVYLIYYDGGYTELPIDMSFFVMILRDGRFLIPNSTAASKEKVYDTDQETPFFKATTTDNLLDHKWMTKNVPRFIKSASSRDYHKVSGKRRRDGAPVDTRKDSTLQRALYEIVVTDTKWIEHLKPGHVWDTTSFDVVKNFPIERED
eukprot:m.345486 g.345486  ORF g.345486 m.345486 type:complete len:193 (+) comp26541_c0_seq1:201-779(+)